MDETTKATSTLCTIVTDRGVSWQQACEILRPSPDPIELNGMIDLDPVETVRPKRNFHAPMTFKLRNLSNFMQEGSMVF